YVAAGIETSCEASCSTKIVESAIKVCNIVIELNFVLVTTHLGEVHGSMEGHLGLRGAQLQGCVPRAAICVIEPARQRMRVNERRIDHTGMRYTRSELV